MLHNSSQMLPDTVKLHSGVRALDDCRHWATAVLTALLHLDVHTRECLSTACLPGKSQVADHDSNLLRLTRQWALRRCLPWRTG
mmetsp:Transcript_21215/g.39108  ORF Transcript_21215/g.39108 Transcript_21215/m.39108 type:complete len:84 (+) Transcript_21215:39-290(+)